MKKKIAILGSTGSIGTSTLEVISRNKKNFDIKGSVDLTDSTINISKLNYIKNQGKKSELYFDVNFILEKNYYIIRNQNIFK